MISRLEIISFFLKNVCKKREICIHIRVKKFKEYVVLLHFLILTRSVCILYNMVEYNVSTLKRWFFISGIAAFT